MGKKLTNDDKIKLRRIGRVLKDEFKTLPIVTGKQIGRAHV